jgi:hypothetical protein
MHSGTCATLVAHEKVQSITLTCLNGKRQRSQRRVVFCSYQRNPVGAPTETMVLITNTTAAASCTIPAGPDDRATGRSDGVQKARNL